MVGGEFLHRAPSDSIVTHWDALFMYSKDLWSGGGRRPELMSAQAAMRSAVRSCASCGEARDPALSG